VGDGVGRGSNDWTSLTSIINGYVEAIDPPLDWEFGPGVISKHQLCVTAGYKYEVRAVAERWLMAGPPADQLWEFRSARSRDAARFRESTRRGCVASHRSSSGTAPRVARGGHSSDHE
jgi:hypothetical protein